MKQVIKVVILLIVGLVMAGCSLRVGDYSLQNDTNELDSYYHTEFAGYLEAEVRSRKFLDMFNLSWGLGWLRGKSGDTVNYSTEDAFYFYPHEEDAIGANMIDTRFTVRAYPLKSVPIFKSVWRFSPYAGAGYGYFTGDAERNSQGNYLGMDIYGGRHYGLNTTSFNFDGTFWSNCFGVEVKKDKSKVFLLIEYRQDKDKTDGSINLDADQILFGLGSDW
ncbi:MAG: hypothetical protein V1739_05340 [Candidatus Omnitrophota bacterium]